jgi:hypothetical protein
LMVSPNIGDGHKMGAVNPRHHRMGPCRSCSRVLNFLAPIQDAKFHAVMVAVEADMAARETSILSPDLIPSPRGVQRQGAQECPNAV